MLNEPWLAHGMSDSTLGDAKDEGVRRKLLAQAGLPTENLITCKQVHSDRISLVHDLSRSLHLETDGLITDLPNAVLGIYTADCVPVFIAEPRKKVVGMLHAGWRGAANGITSKAIDLIIRNWCSDPHDFRVHLGPHIQPCCYEVGEEVASQFPVESKTSEAGGKWRLNLGTAIARQALDAGVPHDRLTASRECTRCNPKFYSFRRDRTEKRMLSFAARRHG